MRKLNPEFVDVMHNALAELRGEKEKLQEMAMDSSNRFRSRTAIPKRRSNP